MKNNETFVIYTFGCKLNFSESSSISQTLIANGFIISESPHYIIVNSCAVTSSAEKKTRNFVSKLHREQPDAQIILLGCYAALQPEALKKWSGVVAVFGNRDKMNVISYLLNRPIPDAPSFFSSFSAHDRTRSFLKIQDGCDYHCAYCTVADARGESRSDSIDHVLDNFKSISLLGINEVNLTGVNIGDFGKNNGQDFYHLITSIDAQHLVPRVRISSIEPNLLTDSIIQLVAHSDIFMPHFHIPLQSGSNRILNLMRRRYNRELFAHKVLLIKELMPHACIAIDIIAGFPDETDADFDDTFNFLDSLPLSYLHVFTYSKRPNTPAAIMKNQVPDTIKHQRTNRLLSLSQSKKQFFYEQHFGEFRNVLWEADNIDGFMFGFTDNYIKVKMPFCEELVNKILPFRLDSDAVVLG